MEEECPEIVAWAKRCSQRETVSKSVALDQHKAYEFVLELMAWHGVK
jgi:glutathione S-transferase